MSVANSSLRKAFHAALLTTLLCAGPPLADAQKAPAMRPAKPNTADYPAGPPFSVDNVLDLLSAIKRNILTEERLMMGLRKRGVDFHPTPEALTRLNDAGASDAVLGAIWKLAVTVPVTPPPPPPAKPTFTLTVACQPAECEAAASGGPFQSTKDGRLQIEGLDAGRVVVDFRKTGFEPRTDVVTVSEKGTANEVTLRPTDETQQHWGEDLASAVLKAITLNTTPRVVTGTVRTSDHGGAIFDVAIHFEASGAANVELQTPAGHATISCRLARCLPSTKSLLGKLRAGKQLKTEDVEDYVPDIEVLLTYEFDEVFSRLLNGKPMATAPMDPSGPANKALRVAASDSEYLIETGADLKPARLTSELATGSGPAGIKAVYGEYRKVGDLDYPSTTELKFGAEQRSILFQAHGISLTAPASK